MCIVAVALYTVISPVRGALFKSKILVSGTENISAPMLPIVVSTSCATIVARPRRLKFIFPFILASTPVCSVIACSILGFIPFSVIIGGTKTSAKMAIDIKVIKDQKILRLYLGFSAILSFLVF